MSAPHASWRTIIRRVFLAPVHVYQRFISPAFPPSCRYAPTCSNYAIEAISTHGILKGTILATWRILRCNPWSLGGVDHVPPVGRWKPDPWIPPEDWAGHTMGTTAPMGFESPGEHHPTDHPATAGRPPKTPSSPNVRSHE